MTSEEHMGCTEHQSIMRGVCYCWCDGGTIFINPRMFSAGGPCKEEMVESDYEACDLAEACMMHWFPCLDEKTIDIVPNHIVLPGMRGECEQLPGQEGFEMLRGTK